MKVESESNNFERDEKRCVNVCQILNFKSLLVISCILFISLFGFYRIESMLTNLVERMDQNGRTTNLRIQSLKSDLIVYKLQLDRLRSQLDLKDLAINDLKHEAESKSFLFSN